jgi:hypothetical protein
MRPWGERPAGRRRPSGSDAKKQGNFPSLSARTKQKGEHENLSGSVFMGKGVREGPEFAEYVRRAEPDQGLHDQKTVFKVKAANPTDRNRWAWPVLF